MSTTVTSTSSDSNCAAAAAEAVVDEESRATDFNTLCQHDADEVRKTLKFYLEAIDAAVILHAEPTAEGFSARIRALKLKNDLVEAYEDLVRRIQQSAAKRYGKVLALTTPGSNPSKTPETMLLDLWFTEHVHVPYPSQEEKEAFSRLCGMSIKQVATWFTNKRARFKRKAYTKTEQEQDFEEEEEEEEDGEPSMKQARGSSTEDDEDQTSDDNGTSPFTSMGQLVPWP